MPDAPVKIRTTTRAQADALVEQLARVTAQIAEFEARPEGRSAVLTALRKHRDELTLELSRIKRYPNEAWNVTRAGTDEFAEAIFKLASGIPNVVRDADKEATVRNDIGVHAVRYRDPLTDGKGWTLIQTAPAADAVWATAGEKHAAHADAFAAEGSTGR